MKPPRPQLTSHALARMLIDRRDNNLRIALPFTSYIPITAVHYDTLEDVLWLAPDHLALCDRGFCYENPDTPGRCPHGRAVGDGTDDPTADLLYLDPASPEYEDAGERLPELAALWRANGLLIEHALEHLVAARASLTASAAIRGARAASADDGEPVRQCCPRCCPQCHALAWYRDHAMSAADTAIRALNRAPGREWQTDSGSISWLTLQPLWEDADLLGCHPAGEDPRPYQTPPDADTPGDAWVQIPADISPDLHLVVPVRFDGAELDELMAAASATDRTLSQFIHDAALSMLHPERAAN
jgi:hypothetical protein